MERKMKDSGIPWIGQIPDHWEICRLKNKVKCILGKMLQSNPPKGLENEYTLEYYLKSRNVGWLNLADLRFDQMWFNEQEKTIYRLKKGDIVVSEGGEIGKSSIWNSDIQDCYIQNSVHRLTDFQCSSIYLLYWLFTLGKNSYFKSIVNTISISHLTKEKLENIPLLFPPLSEQETIAWHLDRKCGEIDELIEVEQQMISDLESYRQSVITEAVTHGLNPDTRMVESDCDWFASHPLHWRTEKIRNLFLKRTEKNNPIKTKERLSLSIDKGITLYADKTTNLDRFKDDFTQYQLAHPNDIVLNSMNMIVGAVGKSAYYGCVSPVYYVIYSKDAKVNMDFYAYLLNTSIIRDVYHKLGQGIYAIERGDGRVNTCRLKVDYYEFSQIRVPVPPIEEQNAIVSFLKEKEYEIDELIKVKQEKIEILKQYRQSLIFEAVTGKYIIS